MQTAVNNIQDVRAVYFNSGGGVDKFHNDRQALNQIGDFFNKGQYSIPVWGACLQASNCLNNRDYAGWAVNFGLGFVEAFTLGYGTGYRYALNSANEGVEAATDILTITNQSASKTNVILKSGKASDFYKVLNPAWSGEMPNIGYEGFKAANGARVWMYPAEMSNQGLSTIKITGKDGYQLIFRFLDGF